jgi:hypothetical protein
MNNESQFQYHKIHPNTQNGLSNLKNKYKILSKLLINIFDNKLLLLENNTENQINSIQEGIKTSNKIVSECINISWIIKPKIEERRTNSINKISKSSAISPAKTNSGRTNSIRVNTPLKKNRISVTRLTTENSISKKNNRRKSEISPFSLKSKESRKTISKRKNKFTSNLDSSFVRTNDKRLTIGNNNLKSLKNSKTQVNILRDTQRKKSVNVVHQKVNSNIDLSNIKNEIKNENKNENKNEIKNVIKNENKNNIKTNDNLELHDDLIRNSGLFKNNDPILIAPMSDLDFVPKGLLMDIDDINSSKLYHVTKFNVSEFIETNLNDILKFLDILDLTNMVLVNKYFRNSVYCQIICNLENERKNFIDIISSIPESEIIPRYSKNDIQFTKGSLKAIRLLNESFLNKIFTEEKDINDDNILLIYHIYFQLINHPLSREILDKKTFWKKTCYYFSHEEGGKIGDLLIKNSKNDLVLTSENIYKILHIIKGNLNKVTPSYFSSICGTTGLFVFYIKDILDFLGISNDKKLKVRAYWTYKDLIDLLDKRIEVLKNYILK